MLSRFKCEAKGLIFLPAIFLSPACASAENMCEEFPIEHERLEVSPDDLPTVLLPNRQLIAALKRIEECENADDDPFLSGTLMLMGIVRYNNGYLLVFDVQEVDDLGLAFLLDSDGKVVRKFQFSSLTS